MHRKLPEIPVLAHGCKDKTVADEADLEDVYNTKRHPLVTSV